jgi:hypothetical protein
MAKLWSIPTFLATAGFIWLSTNCYHNGAQVPRLVGTDKLSSATTVISNYDPGLPLSGAFQYADIALDDFAAANPYYVGQIEAVQDELERVGSKIGDFTLEDYNRVNLVYYIVPKLGGLAALDDGRDGPQTAGFFSAIGAATMLGISLYIVTQKD